MLIPHRFAIDCIDNGWILRNDVIWAKPNGMPESVTDRFSKKHEFMFFFVKQQKYYFDLDSVREKHKDDYNTYVAKCKITNKRKKTDPHLGVNGDMYRDRDSFGSPNPLGKNPSDVSDFWEIPTKPSANEHYASYNLDLIKKPILAGCPINGVIYDPFIGTGTTAIAAIKHSRKFIGSEGNLDYFNLSKKSITNFEAQENLF
jgi:site-specific DNA-methyltransferase (cytosine-N4-specific)